MNVEVEHLPNCQVSLRVVLPPDRVETARKALFRKYRSRARIPGFRPGKAPEHIIAKKFQKEIDDDLRRQLVEEGFREAVADQGIKALSLTEVDEVQFDENAGLKFHAKAITAPTFELPEYKGIHVEIPSAEVDQADVDEQIQMLLERTADFHDIEDRGLQMGDFVVLDIDCSIEEKPVSELSPSAGKSLDHREDLWLEMTEESFLPGFCEPLLDAKAEEQREFNVAIAEDFPDTAIAGKLLDVKAKIKGVKRRELPEASDEWAGTISPDASLEKLREVITNNLQDEKQKKKDEAKRSQILQYLHQNIECELPSTYVHRETQRILEEIVRENQMRGIDDEELKKQEDQIVQNATGAAQNRVKTAFVLTRIAEKEGITVSKDEFNQRLRLMAARYDMPVEKLAKDLYQRGAFSAIEEEILTGKVLQFLEEHASVTHAEAEKAEA